MHSQKHMMAQQQWEQSFYTRGRSRNNEVQVRDNERQVRDNERQVMDQDNQESDDSKHTQGSPVK